MSKILEGIKKFVAENPGIIKTGAIVLGAVAAIGIVAAVTKETADVLEEVNGEAATETETN